MTQQSSARPRRIRAALIGLGLDSHDRPSAPDPERPVPGLRRLRRDPRRAPRDRPADGTGARSARAALGDLDPLELAELAWRIDSPELHDIALRLEAGLEQQGREFEELSAEELTAILTPEGIDAAI